jgi:ABC-2 type transport system permease protein
MKELLAFEFRKLWRSKPFWICTIVGVILNIVSVILTYATTNIANSLAGADGAIPGISSYSGIKFLRQTAAGGNQVILFAIFVTLFICADFSEGTIKNILSRGFSRELLFVSKSITIMTGGLILGILCMASAFVTGSIIFGVGDEFDSQLVISLLLQLLGLLAYVMLDVFLAVLFTKAGGAMTLGIILPLIVPLIAQLIDVALTHLISSLEYGDEIVVNYLISSNLGTISSIKCTGTDFAFAAILFTVYILLFSILGLIIMKRKEV